MNSRRLMPDMGAPSQSAAAADHTSYGPAGRRRSDALGACRGKGQPVLGADLNCSESGASGHNLTIGPQTIAVAMGAK
jgi:hypothetical protein